jgi:acyl-CoA thioester hydrolase
MPVRWGALTNRRVGLESTVEFRARYSETDQMGFVYHANYLVWCEIGRTDLLRQLGATYAEMERQGAFLAVSDARVSFRAAAQYDDLIRVRTTLERMRSRSVTFSYVVENAATSAVLAKAQTELICLKRDRTPRKLPAEIRELLGRVKGESSQEGTIGALSGV